MPWRGIGLLPAILCLLVAGPSAHSAAHEAPLRVVVSFSILQDIARQIGGEDAEIVSLVGPDADAHAFEPSPDQVRLLAAAQLLIVNGLGFESWLTRLTRSAQYGGPVIAASDGIAPLVKPEPGHAEPLPDPHAWQDVRNVMVYAANIAGALASADPAHARNYHERLGRYERTLEALDRHVRDELAALPEAKRRVITTHDAFGYYGKAYGVAFLAPEGVSTDSEPSAKAIADLIRQIRREGIKALFLENIADPRLVRDLAREAETTFGPPLYSDALSQPTGPAPSYERMIQYNTEVLRAGMLKN
jgi:zinc/manganese transport system substrate-binding protein